MKILVIQNKMIGDVLTSSILFEALRVKFPEAELHFLIQPHTKPVVENNPFIDKYLLFSSEETLVSISKRVAGEKYDIIIDAYSKINSAFITAFSGAEIRISYHKKYTSAAYSKTFKPKREGTTEAGLAIENRMLLLQGISEEFPHHIRPKIYLTETERSVAKAFLEEKGLVLEKPVLMLSISGSSSSKTYPIAYMAEVLDFIVAQGQSQLLFNFLPTQSDQAKTLYNLCAPSTKKRIFLKAFGQSLREFIGITSHCNAVIGNEGGAINIAKALGLPSFSIFSPNVKQKVWSTYEDGVHDVSVHVKDLSPVRPSLVFRKFPNSFYYRKMQPALFLEKLDRFLKDNIPGPKMDPLKPAVKQLEN